MPEISIIIPTYNSSGTLPELLRSIEEQSFKDVEVVIMDGVSSDNTLDIAQQFANTIANLQVWSEPDEGIYDAMNKAMSKASGEWIIFMGSDDRFHTANVLHEVAEVLLRTNANVIYGNARIVGNTGWAKDGDIYDGPFDIHKLLNQNICHQAMFYRRSFLEEEIGTFTTEYIKSADWDFNLRCWAKQPFEYMDIVVSDFAAGGLSTNSSDARIVEDYVENVMRYFGIGPFHHLINRPSFIYYKKVRELQRKRAPMRFKFLNFKHKMLNKLKS